jgi:hypothetical protein
VGRLLGAGLGVVTKARLAFQPVGVDHQAARGARRLAVGELGQAGGAAIWARHDLIGFDLAGGFYRGGFFLFLSFAKQKKHLQNKKTFAKQKRTLGRTNTKKIRIQINGTTARVKFRQDF